MPPTEATDTKHAAAPSPQGKGDPRAIDHSTQPAEPSICTRCSTQHDVLYAGLCEPCSALEASRLEVEELRAEVEKAKRPAAPLTCRQALATLLREVAATRDYPSHALRAAIDDGYRALGEQEGAALDTSRRAA